MGRVGFGLIVAFAGLAGPAEAKWVPYPPGNEPSNAARVHADRLRPGYVRIGDERGYGDCHVGRRHRHLRCRIVYQAVPAAWVEGWTHEGYVSASREVPFGLEHALVDFRDAPAPVGYRIYERRRIAVRRPAPVKVKG